MSSKTEELNVNLLSSQTDRINNIVTPALLILFSLILIPNNYLYNRFECLSNDNIYNNYANSYCYSKGTIALLDSERIPENRIEWSFYQNNYTVHYIPFISVIIGLIGILSVLPSIFWKSICENESMAELMDFLISCENTHNFQSGSILPLLPELSQKFLKATYINREYRQGYLFKFRQFLSKYFNLITFDKKQGTWLISWYIVLKLIYVLNYLIIITGMEMIFSYESNDWTTFPKLFIDIFFNGKTWRETRMFPRYTYCLLDDKRNIIEINSQVYFCLIPANDYNERLFLILWFYMFCMILLNLFSLIKWISLIMIRKLRHQFIKCLLNDHAIEHINDEEVEIFINDFLKDDGVFLFRSMDSRCREYFMFELICNIYLLYTDNKQTKNE